MIMACIILGVGLILWWMIGNTPERKSSAPSYTNDLYTSKKRTLEQAAEYWFPGTVYDVETINGRGEPIKYLAAEFVHGRADTLEKTEYPPVVYWKVKSRPDETFAYCLCPTIVEQRNGFVEVKYDGELETVLEIMECTVHGWSTDEINKKYGHRGVRRKRV